MKIKFTWGTGLLITIIVFVTFFVSFIIFSLSQNINLVTEDYFPEEIAYEAKLNKIKNTNLLTKKITLQKKDDKLIVFFPDQIQKNELKGQILFYYITNNKYDAEFKIEPNINGNQIIYIEKLKKGRYYIKIDWSVSGKDFYQEFKITL